MKLMKLLLIGLLSVVAFVACAEDEVTPTAKVRIVGADKAAPVLYDNVTVKLQAINAAGAPITTASFESKAIVGADVSEDAVGSMTVKVTNPAIAAGTITASLKTGTGSTATYDNATYTIVAAKIVGTELKVDNGTAVTLAGDAGDATAKTALVATAKFGTKIVDVTADTTFVVKAGLDELAVSGGNVITATDTFTVEAAAVKATFALLTADVSVTSTVTPASTPTGVTEFTVANPTTMPTVPSAAISLVIKEKVGASDTLVDADISEYNCEITAIATAGAVTIGAAPSSALNAEGTCDTLKNGAAAANNGAVTISVTSVNNTSLPAKTTPFTTVIEDPTPAL